MGLPNDKQSVFTAVTLLTILPLFAYGEAKIQVPPCPPGTTRQFYPDAPSATWTGCKDDKGFYQGLLIQFSAEKEILRIASVKDSDRHGKEIRTGKPGFLEERVFKNGHLDGTSYIFESHSTIGKVLPKQLDKVFWDHFSSPSQNSILKGWLNNQTPYSTLQFSDGRVARMQFGTKDYRVRISKDKRMFFENHPEMKDLFFIDPEPLWVMNPADLKAAILYGFGSCKKYSGPIGRFGRHYDMMIFKQETTEAKHERKLKEIRERFLKFCVPDDIREHLGRMECPPQLPTSLAAVNCILPISDQLHIPYQPKFFSFEFTLGQAPEDLHLFLKHTSFKKFLSSYEAMEDVFTFTDKFQIRIKKTGNGVLFHPLEKDELGRIKVKKNNADGSKDWWEWRRLPGF